MSDFVTVRVSAKSLQQRFNGCEPAYIANVCHGACCRSTVDSAGTIIPIARFERATIEARGGIVRAGLLEPYGRRCPFQGRHDDLCRLHGTDAKPFGCVASPFILTAPRHGYPCLVIRNRYRLLKCYEDGRKLPAYVAFRPSLDLLFGSDKAADIISELVTSCEDVVTTMPRRSYNVLRELEGIHGRRTN